MGDLLLKKKFNRKAKIRVLYDAQVLEAYLCNGGRRGIFFVVYNILKELLRRPGLKVEVYAGTDYGVYLRVKKALSMGGIGITSKIFSGDVKDFDIFLSPRHPISQGIKETGIVCYTIIHDLIPIVYPLHGEDQLFFDIIKSLTWKDHIFAISESTKSDIIRLLPQVDPHKITQISLAASSNFYPCADGEQNRQIRIKYGIPIDKRYLFTVSAIEPRKNLIFILRNFIKFIEKNHVDDLVFVVAGCANGAFEKFFDAEMATLGENNKKIIKTGYVEDEDLASLYSRAECCVFVSLYEGFGLPPLEAMQCGCPVITSNVSSLPEVVGDAGILIDPTSDEAMVAAYEKVYYDEKLRQELSQKGIKRAKNFSWEACVDSMIGEFKKHDFTQQKSSYIVSIPRLWKYLFKKLFKNFIFDISDRPEKTKVTIFGLEIFKIRKEKQKKTFYIFGIPIFKKNYNYIGK
ncbi:MAG: glycosyltransferase family 4 protein [Puniceicoccales bacterium]|jgi:glycosyltransferase involved in cell wall biosynthesis|nr:glycosyltransferase family 4 protein [Puniceicoccales bacterium]